MFNQRTICKSAKTSLALAASSLLLFSSNIVRADSGFFLGGSIGSSTVQAEVPDEDLSEVFQFDENDFACLRWL